MDNLIKAELKDQTIEKAMHKEESRGMSKGAAKLVNGSRPLTHSFAFPDLAKTGMDAMRRIISWGNQLKGLFAEFQSGGSA